MKELTMGNLERCFQGAIRVGAEFIGVKVEMQGFDSPEIIINPTQNFISKLEYYKKAYGEDLVLKTFNGIKIVGFVYSDTFEEIQECLLGFKTREVETLELESSNVEVEDKVVVVDNGEEYPTYDTMVKHMVNKFSLSEDVLIGFCETRDELKDGDHCTVLALDNHLNETWSSDILALVLTDTGYHLIGTKGLRKAILK